MPDSDLFYFAYGSNLSSARLLARVPGARFESVALLNGFRIEFSKHGADGSAKCNIETSGLDDCVHGVVWRIPADHKALLDALEGPRYFTLWRSIAAHGGDLAVCIYVARPGATRRGLRPFDWYRDFVISGAEEHGLPADYVRRLRATPTMPDPDHERASLNRRVLEQGAQGQ